MMNMKVERLSYPETCLHVVADCQRAFVEAGEEAERSVESQRRVWSSLSSYYRESRDQLENGRMSRGL